MRERPSTGGIRRNSVPIAKERPPLPVRQRLGRGGLAGCFLSLQYLTRSGPGLVGYQESLRCDMWLTLRAAREHAFRAGRAPAYLQHLARGRRPDGSSGHVFFGVSIFFCGSTHLLPVQVQPFFPQSVAGFDGSTQILPFQVQPFFRQSTAGFDGSTHLLPVQVHPFFLQSSAGLEGSTHVLPFQVQPFLRQSEAGSDGSMQRAPVHVQPFLRQSSAGSEIFTQRLLASRS